MLQAVDFQFDHINIFLATSKWFGNETNLHFHMYVKTLLQFGFEKKGNFEKNF